MEYWITFERLMPIILAVVALAIAIVSDRRMKTIAHLHIDEKLASMAFNREKIVADKTFGLLETIRNDLNAVSHLRKYMSLEQRERLIEKYICNVLEAAASDEGLPHGARNAAMGIIEVARGYGIADDRLKNLARRLMEG